MSSSVCIHAAEALKERTEKAASEFAPKARGKRLGRNGAEKLAPAYKAQAVERAVELAPVLEELQAAGLSARRIAAELNRRRVATPADRQWHAQTVIRVLRRVGTAPFP
ncbi:MAG TPA: recombinase family protein [Gemmatimonadales bacterium]|nr:recombinase family protein [Gemmatimonadales bacterium]